MCEGDDGGDEEECPGPHDNCRLSPQVSAINKSHTCLPFHCFIIDNHRELLYIASSAKHFQYMLIVFYKSYLYNN